MPPSKFLCLVIMFSSSRSPLRRLAWSFVIWFHSSMTCWRFSFPDRCLEFKLFLEEERCSCMMPPPHDHATTLLWMLFSNLWLTHPFLGPIQLPWVMSYPWPLLEPLFSIVLCFQENLSLSILLLDLVLFSPTMAVTPWNSLFHAWDASYLDMQGMLVVSLWGAMLVAPRAMSLHHVLELPLREDI